MRYVPLLLLLLLAQSLATMSYIKSEDVTVYAYSSKYVAKIPKVLSAPTGINSFDVALIPDINPGGAPLAFSIPIDESLLKQPMDKYLFDGQSIFEDFSVTGHVEMREDYVRTEVSVTNRARKAQKLDVTFALSSKGNKFNVFFPSKYYGRPDNYIVLASPDLKGPALGITSSEQFAPTVSDKPFALVDRYDLRYSLKTLEPGSTFTIVLFFYPFYLDDQHGQKYPLEFSSALDADPLVRVGGSGTAFPTDKLDDIRAQVSRHAKSAGPFASLKSADLSAAAYDSLGMSEYFKQLCSAAGIPCRLAIGERTGTYYAWVQTFSAKWEDVDAYAGVKVAPSGYKAIYTEPMQEFHLLTKEKDVYESFAVNTGWLRGVGERSVIIPVILVIIAAAVVVVVVQLRAGYFQRYMRKPEAAVKLDPNGIYEVLEEKSPYDPLSNEVLRYLRANEGRMEMRECCRRVKFSEPLVESAIVFLIGQGAIRRKGSLEFAREKPPEHEGFEKVVPPAEAKKPEVARLEKAEVGEEKQAEEKPAEAKPAEGEKKPEEAKKDEPAADGGSFFGKLKKKRLF